MEEKTFSCSAGDMKPPSAPNGNSSKPARSLDAQARELISRRTREAMADPDVRKRISEATKSAMRERAKWFPELCALQSAWRAAGPEARRRFLEEIIGGVCDGA